jgi:hypothetical protein
MAAVDGDVVARAGHGQGQGASDPASGAGHQRHAARGGSLSQGSSVQAAEFEGVQGADEDDEQQDHADRGHEGLSKKVTPL